VSRAVAKWESTLRDPGSEQNRDGNLTMVVDHDTLLAGRCSVESMAISKFKATCLAVMERVRRTKRPILVTRFGQPVAEVVPPSAPPSPKGWIGSMAGTARIMGDIVSPVGEEGDWEAGR